MNHTKERWHLVPCLPEAESFIHSFIHWTNLLSTYYFFIKPSFRSPGIKGTQKPHSPVGMKDTSQLSETCMYVSCGSSVHWAGIAPLCRASVWDHLLSRLKVCTMSWPGSTSKNLSKPPVTSRIRSKIQRAPKACFQNLFFHQCLCHPLPQPF